MTAPALSAAEIIDWNEETSKHWQKLFQVYPEALDYDCDVYQARTVRGLLRHIVAVELRYSERLSGNPLTPYEQVPDASADLLFGLHRQAIERYRKLLADPSMNWEEKLEFTTLSAGTQSATRKKILFHALLHGIRHYAQLATLVRKQGVKPDWPMDFLFSGELK
ncbi:hypothetical protein ACPOL_1625 [Acidisarcina polymorpha]|uniref:DinB family protein n=1 Tax=Acidisarcina polymorpha TaxID=2211140 RepID=A0A2Z5FVV4_9BACT|nr:DinB family protein [Acidisarcina polymorpha]AXC10971.1 hypothetical protein ACPOL_1625 [Acidisarcina polymorpha]